MSSTDQEAILFLFTELLCQTIGYEADGHANISGVFIVIIPMSTHVLVKQGMSIRANVVMLTITLGIFVLSTTYWAVSVASLVSDITQDHRQRNNAIRQVFNAVVLVNYVFADGVVVWRMRVLCAARFSKKVVIIPSIMLGLTAVSVFTTIALRSAIAADPDKRTPHRGPVPTALSVSQVVNLAFSFITNVTATFMIGMWAWQYRRSIRANMQSSRSTQVERILVLLAESGLVYCVSSAIVLFGSFVHVSGGTLTDVYTGVHVQIAGMYPALVIILVNTQRTSKSLMSVVHFDPAPNQSINVNKTEIMESMHFNDNPALGNQRGTNETHHHHSDPASWKVILAKANSAPHNLTVDHTTLPPAKNEHMLPLVVFHHLQRWKEPEERTGIPGSVWRKIACHWRKGCVYTDPPQCLQFRRERRDNRVNADDLLAITGTTRMVFVSSLAELKNTKVRDSRQDAGNDPGEGMGAWKRRV
ncbi:uncharacterized protein STEHIDRAFT_109537 [Stereum hirsutum FP-91666 SS1]|uniref:uncharacterized protein n=1 Tax=Stereum hirsutum (strain FP-91666) TaxID=721885 RepID=UPI000440F160|nr:uncharacterized protein STEHIDRAFT_109537 [Stereum hirsutum FP-91666 SS1]EIM89320.1 hypothetical protein STEHIDRAFT_109537 [Stereum hirsutum FP-91666 SS1]